MGNRENLSWVKHLLHWDSFSRLLQNELDWRIYAKEKENRNAKKGQTSQVEGKYSTYTSWNLIEIAYWRVEVGMEDAGIPSSDLVAEFYNK